MISVSTRDDVGYVVLDRPRKLNALTTDMLVTLESAVRELDSAGLRAVVVSSSGAHFSAGADLAEWATPGATDAQRMSQAGARAFDALAGIAVPTIAVIRGVAAGGGLELALACDLRIAGTSARLGLPETGLANLPAYGGVDRLVALVGRSRARELLYTAELVDAGRAAEIGLVNRVVDDAALDDEVARVIEQVTAADPRANALAKALTGGTRIDGLLASFTSQTPESRERKSAFLESRSAGKRATIATDIGTQPTTNDDRGARA